VSAVIGRCIVECVRVCCDWSVYCRVYSCLLSLVSDRRMTDVCQEKLMEVQYFVTRNFR